MGIIINFLDEFKKDYGLVMDFGNDSTMFVTSRKWKMWIQKKCQSDVKIQRK